MCKLPTLSRLDSAMGCLINHVCGHGRGGGSPNVHITTLSLNKPYQVKWSKKGRGGCQNVQINWLHVVEWTSHGPNVQVKGVKRDRHGTIVFFVP